MTRKPRPNIEQQRDMALAALKALAANPHHSRALSRARITIRVVEDAIRDMTINDPFSRIGQP
jgi:hypothetical protein